MDTAQFDELIRNMSQLMETGEASDDLASQMIYQLVAELAKAQPAQWRGTHEEVVAPEAQFRGETGRIPKSPTVKNPGKLTFKPKGPVLMRQTLPPSVSFNKTINVRIGNTVYITKSTEVINILCSLITPSSEATYTWTKDGALLQPSVKIILDETGKMQIQNPTRKEQGIYECSVASHLGSDVESSLVLYAEAPVILSIERNVTKPEHNHLSVVVGGTVEAALQANVTIHCPVKGSSQSPGRPAAPRVGRALRCVR